MHSIKDKSNLKFKSLWGDQNPLLIRHRSAPFFAALNGMFIRFFSIKQIMTKEPYY